MQYTACCYNEIIATADSLSDNWQDFDVKTFMDIYYQPGRSFWLTEMSYALLLHSYPCDDPLGVIRIRNHLRSMTYPDFLTTPYWRSISRYVKYMAGDKCSLCARSHRSLDVHHRDYSFKGIEMLNLRELICLCRGCHDTFHDKLIKH